MSAASVRKRLVYASSSSEIAGNSSAGVVRVSSIAMLSRFNCSRFCSASGGRADYSTESLFGGVWGRAQPAPTPPPHLQSAIALAGPDLEDHLIALDPLAHVDVHQHPLSPQM